MESKHMDDNEHAREQRLRRRLAKRDYRLDKTPARHWHRKYYPPGYEIVRDNTVVWGNWHREYEGTLAGAEEMLSVLVPDDGRG
jgi:hypothetical protein